MKHDSQHIYNLTRGPRLPAEMTASIQTDWPVCRQNKTSFQIKTEELGIINLISRHCIKTTAYSDWTGQLCATYSVN